jgi:hypothetical protein
MALFEHAQKLKPLRQIEATELMINASTRLRSLEVATIEWE